MSATLAPPQGLLHCKRRNRTVLFLTLAGGMVLIAACTAVVRWAQIVTKEANAPAWGSSIYSLLAMILIAIVFGCAALAQPARQDDSATPAQRAASQVWLLFAVLILIHCFVALLFNRAIPGSSIDTFTFQRDACNSVLHGIDPYGTTQANLYDPSHTALFFGPGMVVNGRVQVGFQYPPLTLLWTMPGYLLGDVRYSYIFAVVLSAFLTLAICPDKRGLAIASVLLLSPLTWLVENRCWTEPLVLMGLSATVFAAVKKRWWLPIALGLFLATKQYNVLVLPLIGCFVRPFAWKAYWKLTGQSIAVAFLTVLPFAGWNLRGLWHDLVLFHLAQPFRQDAVSFAVPFPFILKVSPFLLLAFMACALRSQMRKTALFAAAYGLSLLVFVSTNKQAFANYYFLIAQTLFLAAAVLYGETQEQQNGDACGYRSGPSGPMDEGTVESRRT